MTTPACTGTKTCTQCQEEKSVLAFPAQKGSSDGLHSWCRDCVGKANKKRYRRAKRLGKIRRANLASVVHRTGSE